MRIQITTARVKRFLKRTLGGLLLAMTMCAGLSGCGRPDDAGAADGEWADRTGTRLEVYCFDAGKADAFLLTTENAAVLIDCGAKGFGQTILDRLAEQGVDHIDCLIVTHFDRDHVGGAAKVINNIAVETVLQSNHPKDSDEYKKYVKALDKADIEAVTVRETYGFELDGVQFSVDPPRHSDYDNDDSNNSSLIVTVRNGDDTLLFMGDAQTERIEEYLAGSPVVCDFLKIPHHGGEEPLMKALLAAVRPTYAVITCSDEEPESAGTMAALEAAGVTTYLTRTGPVDVVSDGTGLTFSLTFS